MSDPVGSVAEEAAKLLDALQDWAAREGAGGGVGSAARDAGASAAGGLGSAARLLGEHVATGEDCTYCPVCRVIRTFRQTSPEVREHLGVAASALLQALTAALATRVPERGGAGGVEKIDLDEEWPGDAGAPEQGEGPSTGPGEGQGPVADGSGDVQP